MRQSQDACDQPNEKGIYCEDCGLELDSDDYEATGREDICEDCYKQLMDEMYS